MSRKWNTGWPALLSLFLLTGLSQDLKAQGRAMSTADLVRQSDVVAVGKVQAMKSEWSSDKSRIYTRVTLGVDEYIKGEGAGSSITILTPGGEIDGVGEIYSHMPVFHNNEDVVVFAAKDKSGVYRVTGGSQGKVLVEKDDSSGRLFVQGSQTLEMFVGSVRAEVVHQRAK